jgi:hypothetical protein
MKFTKALLTIAAVVLVGAANANAQTVAANIIGSSAIWLEAGQAAALSSSIGASCTWTNAAGVQANDNRPGINGVQETGSVWIAWTPQAGINSDLCQNITSATTIYDYLNTDSTVGNRCVFASCTISITATAGTAGQSLLPGVTDDSGGLPQGIINALLASPVYNVAGTDIRAEDAKFATIRALTPCGSTVDGSTNSQYLGLGYASGTSGNAVHIGNAVMENPTIFTIPKSFHVFDFNIIGNDPLTGNTVPSFATYDVGADPILVIVNPVDQAGTGSLAVNNATRSALAGVLDGTLGMAGDLVVEPYSGTGGEGSVPLEVFIREPLSGTYNTMEYAIPNSQNIKSSQDVGLNDGFNVGLDLHNPCSATGTYSSTQNPLADQVTRQSGKISERYRAIGTGDMVKAVLGTASGETTANKDMIGYSFWSAANFAAASAQNVKYLAVDGVDPLQQIYTDGLVPTAGNGLLSDVSFANIKNGTYSIWSKLRLVATPTGATGAAALATGAQAFVSPSQPDFVPASQLLIVRSHFAPPYSTGTTTNPYGLTADFPSTLAAQDVPQNGTNTSTCNHNEAGGDVGGLIYSFQADGDFCAKSHDTYPTAGNTGRRQ